MSGAMHEPWHPSMLHCVLLAHRRNLIHANCEPWFSEQSEWTRRCKGYLTNSGHCEPLTYVSFIHKGLALTFCGDFFNYLKIFLYVDLQDVNFITQQEAQFPNVVKSLGVFRIRRYKFLSQFQHTLDTYPQVNTFDHMWNEGRHMLLL
jgi:hypothetical protein